MAEKTSGGEAVKEVFVIEKYEHKKDPCQLFATFDLAFAIEEVNRLDKERNKAFEEGRGKPCGYRVTPVPYKEKE